MESTAGDELDFTRPPVQAEQEPDLSLRTITEGVPDTVAIDAQVPDVRVRTEERFADLDLSTISHVAIQLEIQPNMKCILVS
jgi:hypothetical protein